MTPAVLVIDVQRALCEGQFAAFEADRVIARINEVLAKARAASVPIVVIQHESQDNLFKYGTDGWMLAEGLQVLPSDIYIRKTATDSFHKTDLQAVLQASRIEELIICGLQSDFCVDTTTRRALGLGYPVILVSDAHSTTDNEVLTAAQISKHHNVTLANITSFGPRVILKLASQVQFSP